jgi:hypothetical protein
MPVSEQNVPMRERILSKRNGWNRSRKEKSMNYLLFGGAPSVGKSKAIISLKSFLNSRGIVTSHKFRFPNDDFYACFDGTNSQGAKVRILVSSAADTRPIIRDFKNYCASHEPYDFIISAIRDEGDPECTYFHSTMGITSSDFIMEIPMGKITRRKTTRATLKWYSSAIDKLAHTLLGNAPFFI